MCFQFDRQHLADIVKDLGGTAARQYSDSVTHFIHSDPPKGRAVESYKDLKLAKTNGCFIVHPRWVEEVRLLSTSIAHPSVLALTRT